ncbi:hypothetical protein AOC36_09490 [Erysipelothrix larvae]|uniref:Phage holin n=1 Tax=Erysipelothrix larvae TaxID=1514105 RepID=A0A0X8H1B0_9FIRM|nr:phage holin, LLH family [Erysipelothrix larvae]AMC94206.1 hypothetical protein AOC36_09490 [Erysipelothrix larvae]
MQELLTQLTPLLMGIATIVLGYVATKVKTYVDSKLDIDQQEKIYKFVQSTVLYVEQIGVNLDGKEKLALAKEKVLIWANEKGITISDIELNILIEAFVNGLGGK